MNNNQIYQIWDVVEDIQELYPHFRFGWYKDNGGRFSLMVFYDHTLLFQRPELMLSVLQN